MYVCIYIYVSKYGYGKNNCFNTYIFLTSSPSSTLWKSILSLPGSEFLAQDKEDKWLLLNLYLGKTNGVILESGALNGDHTCIYLLCMYACMYVCTYICFYS